MSARNRAIKRVTNRAMRPLDRAVERPTVARSDRAVHPRTNRNNWST